MTDYSPSTQAAQRWAAGASRELTIPVGEVRTALLQAIRALGFATTSEQYSMIEAERGSKLRGLSLTRTRVPVGIHIAITSHGTGCHVEVRVEDRWGSAARAGAAVSVYADAFTEVLAGLDDGLKRADPKAAASFPFWWRSLPEAQALAGSSAAGAAARVENLVQRRTSRLLNGPRTGPTTAVAEAGLETVTFVAADAVAQIAADVVDGMLTAGQVVAASPGQMPPTLVEQVQAMVVLLEERLAAMSRSGMRRDLALPISETDRPVITFLHQQAALRERLPVRLLMSCTTCRLEKVINPDFVRMRERNRRIKVLSSSVGAVFGTHNISPFILVGRLAQVKKSDPDFVCLRCQGTDADEKPITFCPRCGDRRTESVLRTCAKCNLDLRTMLPNPSVWRESTALAAAPSPVSDGSSPALDAPATVAPPQIEATPFASAPEPPRTPAGWHPDPWNRFEIRYWDGTHWTAHVGSQGTTMLDDPAPRRP